MKKLFTYSILAAALGFSASAFAQSTSADPALTFKVAREAVDSKLTFKISAVGGATIQVDWGDGNLKSFDIVNYDDAGYVYSQVSGTLAGTDVKVYAPDAAKINYLDLSKDNDDDELTIITSVVLSKMTGVKDLGISKNSISSLDLSTMSALGTLTANDNKLTSLTLPTDASNLKTVNVSNFFNVAAGKLENAGTNSLLATEWSKAKNLTSLNVAGNPASDLGWFDTFDISANTKLTTLNINGCGFSTLDISNQTALKTLNAQWNEFTSFDLSKMTLKGATVFLTHNSLKTLTLPAGTTGMGRLNVAYNALTFKELPPVGMTTAESNYIYTPQDIVKISLASDNTADLSAFAKVGDKESVFVWKQGTEVIPETAYSVNNGVFKFNADVNNAYCVITNEAFPKLTLTTSNVTSLGLLPKLMTIDVTVPEGADKTFNSFGINTEAEGGQDIFIDWGDGNPVAASLEYTSSDYAPDDIAGEVKGNKITIYGNPEKVTYVNVNGAYNWTTGVPSKAMVTAIDLSALTALKKLNLNYNQIETLDLSNNKGLTVLNLNSNKLTKFDQDLPELTELNLGNYGSNADKKYGDNKLTEINFSKLPKLSNLTVSYMEYPLDFTKLENIGTVYAIGCGLTSVDFSKNAKLTYASLNYNKLTNVDATGITGKANIFLIGNEITGVNLPKNLNNVNLSNNKLTFLTLPAVNSISGTLTYAPQAPVAASVKDQTIVDLATFAKVGETATVYSWTLNGKEISTGISANAGVFTFSEGGEFVCNMKNAAFPKLTLSTTPVKIDLPVRLFSYTLAPEAVGKTMAVNVSSTDNQSIRVNWGNGKLSDPVGTKNYASDFEYGVATGTIAGTEIVVYGSNASTINDLELTYDKQAGPETKMLTIDLTRLSGLNKLYVLSNALKSIDFSGNKELEKVYMNGNNITQITFPDDCKITRIEAQNTANEGNNNLLNVDFSKAPKIDYLIISFNNKDAEATTFDCSKLPALKTLIADNCNFKTVDVSMLENLGQLTIGNNDLETLDLSKATATCRVFAQNNKISELKVPAKLDRLNVSNNKLTFATLPAATIASTYVYNNQKPMTVEATDAVVDLSSQAKVGETETVFNWAVDSNDFKDYTVAGGVFTFTKSATNAVCTMTNAALPKLTLTTVPVTVAVSGVTEIESEDAEEATYYNLQGVKVSGTEPGIYIRRQGNKTTKVIVK